MSVKGGRAWTYDNTRKQCFLHQLEDDKADLNLWSPDVRRELEVCIICIKTMKFTAVSEIREFSSFRSFVFFCKIEHFAFLAWQRSRWFSCTQCSISVWGPESGRRNSDSWKNKTGTFIVYFIWSPESFKFFSSHDCALGCVQTRALSLFPKGRYLWKSENTLIRFKKSSEPLSNFSPKHPYVIQIQVYSNEGSSPFPKGVNFKVPTIYIHDISKCAAQMFSKVSDVAHGPSVSKVTGPIFTKYSMWHLQGKETGNYKFS